MALEMLCHPSTSVSLESPICFLFSFEADAGLKDMCSNLYGEVTRNFLFDGIVANLLLKALRFNPRSDGTIYAASSDGTISFTDIETGVSNYLLYLHPNGFQSANTWRLIYGLDINSGKGVVLVSDNFGYIY